MSFTTDISSGFAVSFARTAEQTRHQHDWQERSLREGDPSVPR